MKGIKSRDVYAFMFYGTFCYLIIMGYEIPAALNTIVSGLLAYYWGSRAKSYSKGD